jgi:glycosyltransferase involved in cell wall biosynthesis
VATTARRSGKRDPTTMTGNEISWPQIPTGVGSAVRIAILGTRGVPARYGGFETAAEEVGSRLAAAGHDVVVYCRNPGQRLATYRGMRLINLPALRTKTLETLSHTALSAVHALSRTRPQVVILFNPANAPCLPMLRAAGVPTAVAFDGLDSNRVKWNGLGRRYFRFAELLSARLADEVVADSKAIGDYIQTTYGRRSTYIPYGAPLVSRSADRLAEVGLTSGRFHLVVSRLEPENNVEMIVRGYVRSRSAMPLAVVGSAPYADGYRTSVIAAANDAVRFLGAIWDQELLDQLYANCASYLHGHSVGGTNPSLLRALGAGAPMVAYVVVFNRETAGAEARYFGDANGVAEAIAADDAYPAAAADRGEAGQRRASAMFVWDHVAEQYEEMCKRLTDREGS